MNMVLHYLKFDLRRWWWLVLAMWLAAALYALCMAQLAQFTAIEGPRYRTFIKIEEALQGVTAVLVLCGVLLSALAGGANSPVRGRAWTMTRPVRRLPLISARGLLVACGVVLPMTLAHAVTLLMMKFSGSAVLMGTGDAAFLFAACALFAALAALVWPCVPALIIGAVMAGIASLLLLIPALRPPSEWYPNTFSIPAIVLAGVVALVPGLVGLWKRFTRREWALRGLWMGILMVVTQAVLPPLLFHFSSTRQPSASTAFAAAPVFEVPEVTGAVSNFVTVPVPPELAGLKAIVTRVEGVAWRQTSAAPWSEWIPVNGGSHHDLGGTLPLDIGSVRALIPEMEAGELRVGVMSLVRGGTIHELALEEGTRVVGDNWVAEVGPVGRQGTSPAWSVVVRSLNTGMERRWVGPAVETKPATPYQSGGQTYRSLPLIDFYTSSRVYGSGAALENMRLELAPPAPHVPVYHVFHLRGVKLERQKAGVPIQTPEPLPVRTWQWETLSQMPQPLTQGGEPGIPGPGTTRGEVAAYLSYLTTTEWDFRQGPWGWPESKRREFAALVPQWLPLFLQAIIVAGERRGAVIESALQKGTPEDRRVELIQRIPESPLLARIAIQRGWLAEATPQLTELFKKAGGIPDVLDALLPQLRDRAFHHWLRAKFRSTVPMIRLWQSDPALAKDLPDLLAAARQRIRSTPPKANQTDADEVNGLLFTGDTFALDQTIRCYFNNPNGAYWPKDYIRRWLRTADDQHVPYEDKALQPYLRGLTAADFTWNAARGLFIQKPTPSKP